MPDWSATLLVALIGLAGTLIASYLGYRQWRRGRQDSLQQDVLRAKRNAYKELWELIERTHAELRRNPDELSRLHARIADVNSFVLAHEVYLADHDHRLVNEYLEALGEMVSWAQREADPLTRVQLEDTAPVPREAHVVRRAFGLRDEVKAAVRKVLESQ